MFSEVSKEPKEKTWEREKQRDGEGGRERY